MKRVESVSGTDTLMSDGALVQDFAFVRRHRALHLLNAPSPAATASLAIGWEIVAQMEA